jgi:hypothetical protein
MRLPSTSGNACAYVVEQSFDRLLTKVDLEMVGA